MRTATFRLIPLLCLLLPASPEPGRAQSKVDAQSVRGDLGDFSESYAAGDLEAAEAEASQTIATLAPAATSFGEGFVLNTTLHLRASLRFSLGRLAEAEADLIGSVAQARGIEAPSGLDDETLSPLQGMLDDAILTSLRGLMNLYLATGDLEKATAAFQEARDLKAASDTRVRSGGHVPAYLRFSSAATSMEGTFYRATGDYTQATEALLTSLETSDRAWPQVVEENGGQEDHFTDTFKLNYLMGRANLLMELAEISVLTEQYEAATGYAEQARESAAQALPVHQRWMESAVKENPADDPELLAKTAEGVRLNLQYLTHERAAAVFRAAGEHERALELLVEGVEARGDAHPRVQMLTHEDNLVRPEESFRQIGDLRALLGQHGEAELAYRQAEAALKSFYPEGHPAYLDLEESRALLAHAKGETEAAHRLGRSVQEQRLRQLRDVLAFADESQRLAYRSSVDLWSLPAHLGLEEAFAEAVVRTKGIVLESMIEDDRLTQAPGTAEIVARLERARGQLMARMLGSKAAADAATADLRQEIETLETRLREATGATDRSQQALETSVADVRAALPENAVLIDMVRFRQYTGPGAFLSRYGALVFTADRDPVFVALGRADAVDRLVETYAVQVRTEGSDEDMTALLRRIEAEIWTPLAAHLPPVGGRILLSPDGSLNFFSFASLLTENGEFVGEHWPVSYVTSARDLLRGTGGIRESSIEIIANPDFPTPAAKAAADAEGQDRDLAVGMRGVLGRIALPPLPGTLAEEKGLRQLITSQWSGAGWTVTSHLDREATEARVAEIASPGILHLATHGFYLPATGRADLFQRGRSYWESRSVNREPPDLSLQSFEDIVLQNPMHRSGLALTGGEATLRQWGAGQVPDAGNDGILTAEEISRLRLDGTWLVVLSACETGIGKSLAGEGVLGMRRGLMQAGASHLLLTLWPVADEGTADYMVAFYTALQAGQKTPQDAAAQAQATFLKTFRERRGTAAAVRLAAPFILSFQQ